MTTLRLLPTAALLSAVLAVGIATIAIGGPAAHANGNAGGPVPSSRIDHGATAIPAITVIGKRSGHAEEHTQTKTGDAPKSNAVAAEKTANHSA